MANVVVLKKSPAPRLSTTLFVHLGSQAMLIATLPHRS